MNVVTTVQTTHTIELNGAEKFDITNIEGKVVRVDTVIAQQRNDEWYVEASGERVLKSGKLSSRTRVDTWWHSRRFILDARRDLIADLPQPVREELFILGAVAHA